MINISPPPTHPPDLTEAILEILCSVIVCRGWVCVYANAEFNQMEIRESTHSASMRCRLLCRVRFLLQIHLNIVKKERKQKRVCLFVDSVLGHTI